MFYLIAMRLESGNDGGGGVHESADSCRMGKVENVETVKLVCVGRLLRMGCDLFLMSVRGFVGDGETLWEQNGLPWEHSAENQWEGREAETESLILWLVVLELLAGGWWLREIHSLIKG